LIFAPDAGVMAWVESELGGQAFSLQVARSAREIVTALVDDPPPRAQILVSDFDALSASDVLGLHAIRDRGWFGSIVALGNVSPELRASLSVEQVLGRPLVAEQLRTAVTRVGLDQATRRIPKLR
jgi:hypothetical protein